MKKGSIYYKTIQDGEWELFGTYFSEHKSKYIARKLSKDFYEVECRIEDIESGETDFHAYYRNNKVHIQLI